MSPPVLTEQEARAVWARWDETNLFHSRKSSPNSGFTSTIQLSSLTHACVCMCVFQM